MSCRWVASDQPRVLPGRHDEGCDGDCRGCLPCPDAHCRVDGMTHVDYPWHTCPECRDEVRTNLAEVQRMCADLPAEVEVRGVSSEAFHLLGPVADPEARGYHQASAAVGRIDRRWLEESDDERHPLTVLGTWRMVLEDTLSQESGELLSVDNAAGYLDRNLTLMSGMEHVPFEDFARDLRDCVRHMERVLHDGEQIEKGAPCLGCDKPLTREYGKRAVDDRWVCNNRACDVTGYTTAQYRGWVEDTALHEATSLPAAQMPLRFRDQEGEARVSAGEVRVWGTRELVAKRGKSAEGLTLYDVAQVEARLDEREERQSA